MAETIRATDAIDSLIAHGELAIDKKEYYQAITINEQLLHLYKSSSINKYVDTDGNNNDTDRSCHADIIATLKVLVKLHAILDKVAGTIKYSEDLLCVVLGMYDSNHEESINAMMSLAAYLRKGTSHQKEESELLYMQVLQILRELYGGQADHIEIAKALMGLGITIESQDRLSEAKAFYEEALKMRRALYNNQDHTDIGDSLLCLASLLARIEDLLSVSMIRYEQALLLYKNLHGTSHPRVKLCQDSLQLLYRRIAKNLLDSNLDAESLVIVGAAENGCIGSALVSTYVLSKSLSASSSAAASTIDKMYTCTPSTLATGEVDDKLTQMYAALYPCIDGNHLLIWARADLIVARTSKESECIYSFPLISLLTNGYNRISKPAAKWNAIKLDLKQTNVSTTERNSSGNTWFELSFVVKLESIEHLVQLVFDSKDDMIRWSEALSSTVDAARNV